MSSPGPKLHDIAAEWRAARRVYPIYAAILKRFDLGVEPCRVLVSPIDRSDNESLTSMREWLAKMDELCTAYQLRQTLQAASIGTEPSLRALAQRYLAKDDGVEAYRDRVDFLLVQYFCQFAPLEMHGREPKLEDVAKVLETVIGESSLRVPGWAAQVELLLVRLAQCVSLKDLEREGILEQGRKLKEQAGAMYFGSGVMLAFARYNFLVRRAFVRLMRTDLESIQEAVNALERRKVATVDASQAGMGAEEPLAAIRRECRDWRKIYLADYASGGAFAKMIALREAVETALANAPEPEPEPVIVEETVATVAPAEEEQQHANAWGVLREQVLQAPVSPVEEFTIVPNPAAMSVAAPGAELPVIAIELAPAKAVASGPASMPMAEAGRRDAGAATSQVADVTARSEVARVADAVPKAELVAKDGGALPVTGAPAPRVSKPVVIPPKPQVPETAVPKAPMPGRLEEVANELIADDLDGLDIEMTFPLPDALEKITEQLAKAELQKVHLAVANVTLGSTRILLSSWEVDAFLRGGDDLAETLQIAVTARAVLTEAVDRRKRTGSAPDLRAVLTMAQAEAGALQERIAQARDAKNLDAAVNLSATARRLISLMDEAEANLRDGVQGRAH